MDNTRVKNTNFQEDIAKLGFVMEDDCLHLTNQQSSISDPEIQFHIEKADELNASAVYLRRQVTGSYKPQVYLFDFTDRNFEEAEENEIAEIQTRIWSSGEAPLACVFYNTEIKIIDCTKHVTADYKPEYLVKDLQLVGKVNNLYNEQFAIKIKSGIFWEQEELKNKFKFQNSAYDKLIDNIRFVAKRLTIEFGDASFEIVNKIIIQAILIKYLEERIDNKGNKLLSKKYFQKYDNASTFNEVLKQQGKFAELLSDLNTDFNGNVFKWEVGEQKQLKALDLSIVADLLATDKMSLSSEQLEIDFPDWRYFEFKLIPVELISRLYEEFLGEDKQEKGLYYTPSHLAKLLVDECIPLKKYKDFDLKSHTILDPACGSGIFLVVAFKRLVQIWRLQNNMKTPDIGILKSILKNIYGVDKEEQAVRLASFSLSLALCNELKPVKILNELRFDDLTEENLIHSDFFECKSIKNKKFDLVIGNPPFKTGAISSYSNIWGLDNKKIKIPQGQIALKFLSESFNFLNDSGLVCLIIKSSGLLYNSTSNDYKKALFSNYNAVQILDFTALAEGKSLWDNGARVGSAAIFIKNEKPDYSKNILHLTFRRTKATKDRIVFEIDDYDLHFVNRQTAINNEFIWKNNLLGGGRTKNLVEKVQGLPILKDFLIANKSVIEEGLEIGSKQNLSPEHIYKIPFLPTEAISEVEINYDLLTEMDRETKFSKVPSEESFFAPNLIIWENIGEKRFPIFYNEKSFSFKRRLISIKSINNDTALLKGIYSSFEKYYNFYKFYFLATSSETLINRNNTFLLKDFKNLPLIEDDFLFSDFDLNVIKDSLEYQQDFFIHGEKSKALQTIKQNKLKSIISNFGIEFSRALNVIYEDNERKFRLSDVVQLENSLIATIFKYDNENSEPIFSKDLSELNIEGLTNSEISAHLSINRIIKLYPQKDTVVFVKPNQYRYWLSSTAYRDADKCFSDLSNLTRE
ncbi:SAM-dependent methyltransferase [Chryseobacterium sp. Ch-15]|uniref:site-specific DNA-methyltransferase (adenine-specific) n=1 Tax=Chryseobacterium muglaense TaxID=2893752 RepID=A0A9Q3YUY3_9FLAO|nr:N-6 DNA methylase [Chryseobacterium muglaense]MBD3903365.1 N-6 DNA methylase [Chryseobacterium muglaense]MCC9036262.1 SAM-dependent methyltransferase [Chryseobacterium muglaense]MCM2554859.1 SAM-dependent methyltransferase [Chryseobacterium muglaense]